MVNHAIVVEGFGGKDSFSKSLQKAHTKARKIFKGVAQVTAITREGVNGSSAFLVAPDGSKEGWDASDRGDEARREFKSYLRQSGLDWVEVKFGGDYHRADVEDDASRNSF